MKRYTYSCQNKGTSTDIQKSIRIDPPGGIAGAVIAALWMAICLHCFIRMFEKYWAIGNRSYTNIRPCRSRRVGRLSRERQREAHHAD